MGDKGRGVAPPSESRKNSRASALATLDHGKTRTVQAVEVRPSPSIWLRDPVLRRRLRYGLTCGAPALLLGILIFAMEMSPFAAFLVSAMVYMGLFMLFIWQPPIEIERETIAEDVRKSLARSRLLIHHIRNLTPQLALLLEGSDCKLRLERIGSLADLAVADLEGKEGTSLGTADRLERRLTEFSALLELFCRTARAQAGSALPSNPLGGLLEEKILSPMERWLRNLSTSLGAEDAINFEIAVRVMRDTLEAEGASRKE